MLTIDHDFLSNRKLNAAVLVVGVSLMAASAITYMGGMLLAPSEPISGFKIENTSQTYRSVTNR